MAAFVEFILVWSFSTVDNQETLDMLTERTKAAQLGLGSNYDAQYLNSFMQRYPRQLLGKGALAATSTTVIEVLKDWSDWMGVGGINGNKQKLTQGMAWRLAAIGSIARPTSRLRTYGIWHWPRQRLR